MKNIPQKIKKKKKSVHSCWFRVEFSPSHSLKFANPHPRKTSTSRGPILRRWQPRRMVVVEQRRWQLQAKQAIVFLFGKEPLEPDFLWARQTNTEGDSPDKTNSPLRLSRESLYLFLMAEGTSCIIMLLCSATVRVVACLATSSSPPFLSFLSYSLLNETTSWQVKKKHNRLFLLFFSSLSIFCFFPVSEDKQERLKCLLLSFYHFILPRMIFHSLNMYNINLSFFFVLKPIRYHNVYINHIRM